MPTGYPSLTKNQKQEIDAMTVLLVVLTQRRFYWSCLRNDGTGFIGRAYATTVLLVVLTQRRDLLVVLTQRRDLLVVLTQRRDLLVVLTQRRGNKN